MVKQIIIDQVFKVFGDEPQAALELVHQGCAKQDILARTSCTIGVFDASLTIKAGEIFVVMGLSGSGKSTLVRMLSMVFQSFALMPHMTVLDNTALGLELAGVGRVERRELAAQALEQVGLDG